MVEKHDKFVCKTCGHFEEIDSGWAGTIGSRSQSEHYEHKPSPPEVAPVEREVEKDSQYYDVGLGFALGDCTECGGHSWQRVSLSSLEKKDPQPEKTEGTEEAPKDKYVCKQCGDVLELELGQTELPGCVKCGSDGWLKESF